MNRKRTLAWLADFQQSFGAALCMPLDPTGGALHANLRLYPAAACARVIETPQLRAANRLAVYNRQYWFRLLRTLQGELPLTSRLFGLWSFNQHAMRFLCEQPPHHYDLGSVCQGFEQFLGETLVMNVVPCPELDATVPRAALLEAVRLDLAFRRVFLAPPQPWLRLSGDENLEQLRIRPSAAYARVTEHWPLVKTRSPLLAPDAPHVVALPQRMAARQTWALFRTSSGVGQLLLEREHARLLALLERHSVGAAVEQLASETAAVERPSLPARVQCWLAQSVELGFFSGTDMLPARLEL